MKQKVLRQEHNEALDSFRQRLRAGIDNVIAIGGSSVLQPELKGRPAPTTNVEEEELSEEFAAMFFAYQADQSIYGSRVHTYEQWMKMVTRMRFQQLSVKSMKFTTFIIPVRLIVNVEVALVVNLHKLEVLAQVSNVILMDIEEEMPMLAYLVMWISLMLFVVPMEKFGL